MTADTHDDSTPSTYPRQRARTRGFRLGVPRSAVPAPDGTRVVFIRSRADTDPVGDLWVADVDAGSATVTERCVVQTRTLLGAGEDLPEAERARRERLREVSEGIASYSTDTSVRRVGFAVGGQVFTIDVTDPRATAVSVPTPGPAVDPRLSPDGTHIGFVVDDALVIVDLSTHRTLVVGETDDTAGEPTVDAASTIGWGLADFIAAEEFSRVRGWWWLADGSGVIVERVDTAPVDTWWIADPAQPANPPRSQRYPAAGRPNAELSLWIVSLDGQRREIPWDHDRFPYLTGVAVGRDGGSDPIIAVLSRDQRDQLVLRVDAKTGDSQLVTERHDDAWIDIVPGLPRLDPRGRLVEVVRDIGTDSNRLTLDGSPVSPAGFNVRDVDVVDDASFIVHGSIDPIEEVPVVVDDAGWHPIIESGVASARRAGDIIVLAQATPTRSTAAPGTTTRIGRWTGTSWIPLGTLASHARPPLVSPRVHLIRAGADALPTAILWPTGYEPGTRRLPVLLAPYGGPHARRVVDSRLAFATDQWWADQGMCVVIADGRGTPGRGPAWERAIRDDLATPVLDDQIHALDAVLEAFPDDTDPDRVGIHGWSFGGYLAALAVLRRPDRVHAAVAGAPVTDWRLYDTAYTERYLGDPSVNDSAYEHCSLIAHADRLTRPLLLVHGLADDNVVVAHTLQLSSALLAAGRTHQVLPLSGVTHMTPQEVVAENLLLAQRDFLVTHLLGA